MELGWRGGDQPAALTPEPQFDLFDPDLLEVL